MCEGWHGRARTGGAEARGSLTVGVGASPTVEARLAAAWDSHSEGVSLAHIPILTLNTDVFPFYLLDP